MPSKKEEEHTYKTIERLYTYPIFSDTSKRLVSGYTWFKAINPLVTTTMNLAETVAKKAVSTAQPMMDKMEKNISKVDDLVDSKMGKLEEKYPLVKKPTEEVLQETQKMVVDTVKPVVKTALLPATTVFNFGKKQVGKIVEKSAVLTKLEDQLNQMHEEWVKEVERLKREQNEKEKEKNGKSSWTSLVDSMRVSVTAGSTVFYDHLSEENQTRLSNAKEKLDSLREEFSKVKTSEDMRKLVSTEFKKTMQYAQDAMERSYEYLTSFFKKSGAQKKKGDEKPKKQESTNETTNGNVEGQEE